MPKLTRALWPKYDASVETVAEGRSAEDVADYVWGKCKFTRIERGGEEEIVKEGWSVWKHSS